MEMKYKVGDKVRVKSLDWYNENRDKNGVVMSGSIPFIYEMSVYCGNEYEIETIFNDSSCYLKKLGSCSFDESFLEPISAEPVSLRYNTNKPKWSLMDYESIEDMLRVLAYGRHKYSIFADENGVEHKGVDITPEQAATMECLYDARDNWKNKTDMEVPIDSLQRHIAAIMKGEQNDKESGLPHIAHVMANAMFYSYHSRKG